MTKSILRTNEMFPVRLVFLIDILLTGISFVLSYFLCSLILPDIWSHGMLVQLPIIVALTSLIFLFIGIYKGYVKYDKVREVYSIFNAICITNILTIILVVVNGKLFMEKDLMVPLSIIIVHSILSFSALVASRYLFKFLTVSNPVFLSNKQTSIFAFNGKMGKNKANKIINLLQQRNGENEYVMSIDNSEHLKEKLSGMKTANIESIYLHQDFEQSDSNYKELLNYVLTLEKPVYLVDLKFDTKSTDQNELVLSKVSACKNELQKNQKLSTSAVEALEKAISAQEKISDIQAIKA